ncbi:MAG TPA: DNA gyrase inhibitor YacG [Rhizomicrobium sp.]|jgi:hypothetical protein|nr:DNA gyrase inhibitor YacG [Rhizomicrobium sp.]
MSEQQPENPDVKCPICGKPQGAEPFRPFCSKRCADIDLGHWLKGSYTIPGDEDVADSEAPSANDNGEE